MPGKSALVRILIVAGITAAIYMGWPRQTSDTNNPPNISPPATLSKQHGRYLFNVTLHTPEEIAGMLTRAEQLAQTMRPENSSTGIALVLHGPEIEIFTKKNYRRFQKMVDQAAQLHAEHIIEVKMCLTEMQRRGVRKEDIPAFIELVPYGPDEEERLRRSGYVYL